MKISLPTFIVVSTTIGFFGLLVLFAFIPIEPDSRSSFGQMIGTVGGAWVTIVAYHFGSSSGSAKKTDILNKEDKEPK